MSRKRGLVLNTFWIINSTIVGFLRSIVLIPVLLKFLSLELYNFWVVLMSALAIVVYVLSGFQRFAANEYNLLFYVNKRKAIHLLGSGLRFFITVAILGLCLVTVFCMSGGVARVFGTTGNIVTTYGLGYCLFFVVALSLLASLTIYVSTSIEPLGKYYINSRYAALNNLLEIVFWITVLLLSVSFLTIILAYLLVFSLYNIGYAISLLRKYKVTALIFTHGTWREGAILFKRSLFFLINNFAEKLSAEGLNFVVSIWYMGVNALPAVQSVRTMTNVSVTGGNAISGTFSFEMQRMTAQGDNKRLVHIFHFLWLTLGLVINMGAILVYPFLVDIYKTWLSNKVAITEPFFYTMFAMSLIIVYGTVIVLYMKAINEVRKLFTYTVIKSLLLLSLLFILPRQILYVAIGLLVAETVFNVFLLNGMLIKRFGDQKELRIVRRICWSVAPFILTAVYFMIGYRIPGATLLKTSLALLIVGAVYAYQLLHEKNFIFGELLQMARNRLPFLRK